MLSTFLVNLVEEKGASQLAPSTGPVVSDGHVAREKVLVSRALPLCFDRPLIARRMYDTPCRRSSGLCGRELAGLKGPRQVASVFLHGAAASIPSVAEGLLHRRALGAGLAIPYASWGMRSTRRKPRLLDEPSR
jgi:hypothetical protein